MSTRAALVIATLLAGCAQPSDRTPPIFVWIDEVVVCDRAEPGDPALALAGPGCARRSIDDIDPQGKVMWLKHVVSLPDHAAQAGPLGVFVLAMASSEVFWNGQSLGRNGVPGARREDEVPGLLDADFFLPPSAIRPGPNLLVLELSSFHNPLRVHTPVHGIVIAPYREALGWLSAFYLPSLMTAGVLVLAAIYFAVRFVTDRRDRSSLLVALMAGFSVAQLAAEAWRGFGAFPYPMQVPRLIAIALCSTGFGLCAAALVLRRFAPHRWLRYLAVAAVLTFAIAPFAPGFDPKALLGALIPICVALVTAIRAALRRTPGAGLTATALAGFVALVAVDPGRFLDRPFYMVVTALAFVLVLDEIRQLRHARAAEQATRAHALRLELELWKRRIAPHFLMNTLNALIDWVESNPQTGVKMIEALAAEFRLLSQMSDRALVAIADEIALCERHLEVMSYRVDRPFALAVEGVDRTLAIPPGVLHTLVENAFTHGRFDDGATFRLGQTEVGDAVHLTLRTPAPSRPGAGSGRGEGTAYVRSRLAAAFGARAALSERPDGGGWLSVISLTRPP
jgi:hypothetical protein